MGGEVTKPFSWWIFVAGLLIAVVTGSALNLFLGLVSVNRGTFLFIAALVMPGIVIGTFALVTKPNGLREGLITGACLVALAGGICGAVLSGG